MRKEFFRWGKDDFVANRPVFIRNVKDWWAGLIQKWTHVYWAIGYLSEFRIGSQDGG